ncbi:hypothetical protein [Dorea phocaeensis]|uniref:hypothetical protein n=1 Tax=Dorea phocaeensis TaxID=2040291 RepID=UPI000C75C93E|nr:hypothetical protein [Dorea phocaeensis]
MEHKLILCQTIKDTIDNANPNALSAWATKGYSSPADLLIKIKDRLNLYNSKLNISDIEVRSTVEVYGSSCNYLGLIESVEDKPQIKAYVFFTQPVVGSRSAFFEQQFFPVISSVIENGISSNEYHLTNRPVYIVNINTDNMTPSMALSVYSGKVVGFHIIDMMDNDVNSILLSVGYDTNKQSITEFDKLITNISVSRPKANNFFDLDCASKRITYKDQKFRDKSGALKTTLTNEPYWFMLRSLAALYLVDKEGYSFDVSSLTVLSSNKSLGAFVKYVKKIGG